MSLRVVFMGTPEFAVPTLRALHEAFDVVGVVTQPEKAQGRGRKTLPTPVKSVAMSLAIPAEEPSRINDPQFLDTLKQWAPDVIVVAAFGKILPQEILQLPPLGCVNLHASLLPRYRGASPISAAILAGDKVSGVCTILMDAGMDTGDILLVEEIPINEEDTAGSLHDRMLEPGARLVVESLTRMLNKTIKRSPQQHEKATYTKPLSKEDGRLDWNRDAPYLSRIVRAMNPWPVASSILEGEILKIWQAVARAGSGDAGSMVAIDREGITVGTGDGLLLIKEVQAPGKKRLPASEFARGRRLRVGQTFEQ
ncbi:MAG: methionyl-tRNA formyltransferase [Thermodesulfobacteriota bacterium]